MLRLSFFTKSFIIKLDYLQKHIEAADCLDTNHNLTTPLHRSNSPKCEPELWMRPSRDLEKRRPSMFAISERHPNYSVCLSQSEVVYQHETQRNV